MSKNVEKEILDFWENKEHYADVKILKAKAREYYSEEFMNKYSKWSENLKSLNEVIKNYMIEIKFPMQYWKEISYDWFCTNINNSIEEWINVNNDIKLDDIPIITEKLIADYITILMTECNNNAFTIATLMESIKRSVIIKRGEF